MITVSYKDTNGVRELVCSGHAGYKCREGAPSVADAMREAGEGGARRSDNPSVSFADSSPCTGEPYGAAREEGDPSGEALGMTPHPSSPSAPPPSPQGEGKGGAAAAGGDIVCAAASALTGTLAAVLLKHDEEFFSLFVGEGDGECRIVCAGAAAKPYFEFALVGLKKLAEAFPENVRVADFRESEEFY